MNKCVVLACSITAAMAGQAPPAEHQPADPPHPVMTWVKQHPREGAAKPSPRLGYETTYGYDWLRRLLIRHAGHNQGGGGEQNAEVWTYDLDRDEWTLKEPNDAPPGTCCDQQNVFDDALRKFIRFPAFSGSHGWQSQREIYLKNSSVWTYDLDTNAWRYMRPCPEVWPSPLRGAAYDVHHQVTVVHGGEGSGHGTVVYDLYANTWTEMKPKAPAPAPNISQPGFTYDAVNRLYVLFGSQFQDDERTWAYDLPRNEWRVLPVAEHPPGRRSCPVLAADTRNGIILCSVLRGGEKDRTLETWALDVARNAWTRLKLDREPDTSGSRNRVLIYLPDRNLFVLENRTDREQQLWTFRYADAPPPPPRPQNLEAVTTADGAELSWQPPTQGAKPRYNLYRGEGATPWAVEWAVIAEGLDATTFTDPKLERGKVYYYQVRPLDAQGKEGTPSFTARTQPPAAVHPCVSVLGPERVEVAWDKLDAPDIAGYHVERADVSVYSTDQLVAIKYTSGDLKEVKPGERRYTHTSDLAVGRVKRIGQFRRLTQQPIVETSFVDETADLAAGQREPEEPALGGSPLRPGQVDPAGKPYRFAVYAYRVRAVNRLGVESGPSPFIFTYPAAVQHVFAKEEPGGKTRLKWAPNSEKGIKGYLVYRQNGRWNRDPIVRLTPEPIAATEFLDETSGEITRRYELVAVDALGQEGEPSQPIWSRREWRAFYVPYTTEWHQ